MSSLALEFDSVSKRYPGFEMEGLSLLYSSLRFARKEL